MEYIQGYKFKNIPETVYYNTHDAHKFIKMGINTGQKLTLVTHNSDMPVSEALGSREMPYNLTWYSTNVDIEHPQIRSIPIGLENPEWHQELGKLCKIHTLRNQNNNKSIFCTAMFNPGTYPKRLNDYKYFADKHWCKSRNTLNGAYFDQYIVDLQRSVFAVCPRGNGIDTHRFWEAQYLKTIPIVEDCINIRFYKDKVPMVIVQDFEEVNEKFLLERLENMGDYSHDVMDMSYWINKIRSH